MRYVALCSGLLSFTGFPTCGATDAAPTSTALLSVLLLGGATFTMAALLFIGGLDHLVSLPNFEFHCAPDARLLVGLERRDPCPDDQMVADASAGTINRPPMDASMWVGGCYAGAAVYRGSGRG